jgi:hypothetical protein
MADTQQVKQSALDEILSKYKVAGREQIDAVSGLPLADQITYTNQQQRIPAGKKPLPTNAGAETTRSSLNWDYKNGKQGYFGATPQTTVAATPEVATTTPAGIDPDLYAKYKSSGLTDDQIGRIHGATPETPFSDIFKKTEVAPEPIDEARVNASRNVANLGEGIKVLGDMFAVGQGARIGKRNAGDIVAAQSTKEDTERNKYLAKLEGFKAGERQAAEKDWMLAFQDREKRAAEVKSSMKEMRDREDADKKFNRQIELKEAENKRDDYWKGKAYDYKDAENKREDYWKGKEYGLKVRALSNSEAKTSKGISNHKGKGSKENSEVLINGKKMWLSNAIIKDVAGRARSNEKVSSGDKSIYEGMNDEAIFNKEKQKYIKILNDNKIVLTNTPGEWGDESSNKAKVSSDIDDIAKEFDGRVVKN